MARTRIKICGITRVEDGLAAIEAGADALGFVFYPPSPRAVTAQQAAEIIAQLPPFVTFVGLFVNASADEVKATAAKAKLSLLQFHGDEAPAFCGQFDLPYMKAIRMRPDVDLNAAFEDYADANALLLDAYTPGIPGGTGESFDWQRVPQQAPKAVVLAGGLTPDNIADAVAQVKPYGVDVSGGVEATKGIKDRIKLETFIKEVNRADEH